MIGKALVAVALSVAAPVADPPPVVRATVTIASDPGVALSGELQLPAGKRRPPVVLLLGGGGPSPHGIYPLLEKRLLARGIATLSFDKRGVGASSGAFLDAMDVAQRDAAAVLAWLRTRGDVIDPARIAVLGVSQGGVIGPALAVDVPPVAAPPIVAVVMMAAPAGERGVLFLDAMREQLALSGMKAEALSPVIDATRRYLDGLTGGAAAGLVAADRAAIVDAFVAEGWTRAQGEGAVKTLGDPATSSLYTVGPGAVLRQVTAPVLAVYAAGDTVVTNRLAIPSALAALEQNPDATIAWMPKVEHGFKPLVATVAGKREYQGWPISDPDTIDLIDRWLGKRLGVGE
ncbi:alpha/beta fold hydrolase [Sphingomonas sp. 2R-10]|uniref:alpha/beta hydrolase n=1 Tax=Sphingomonas sp. 2R-10 TaxID=3045148 RepID=UPI000F78C5D5|nr:alpha/beta hydrolase [Sphingomonas sp. 2R-10]MDJ0278942.1 alpha/beta fold hydrolase [Sphingomonas sp. 2R-10]